MKKNIIIFILSILIVSAAFFFLVQNRSSEKEPLSTDEITSNAINFIDETYIRGTVEIGVIEVTEESGVYKIALDVGGERIDIFTTLDGKILFLEGIDLEGRVSLERTIGGFTKIAEDPCLENGKPIVYFFGSEDCPFCQWQQPVLEEAVEAFGDRVVLKSNIGTDADLELFYKYSDGGVPLIVAGCNYFRVGAGGFEGDEESDKEIISAFLCKLTNGEPKEVCQNLEEIINQI
ncbi:MAG: hypothetical protein PHP37_04480 [Patescibacteria group bacterium]|jgi:thiol-disulfide isomerase/thioredoxin|nr:hypothetical protein [Patescibacteria group bacterium]